MHRLLLVDDHELVLGAMNVALSMHLEFEVVASAGSLTAGLQALRTEEVDVVVADLELNDGQGTELVALANTLDPAPAVLLIAGTEGRRGLSAAVLSGCAGFVSKEEGFDVLVDAIATVASGGLSFPAQLLQESQQADLNQIGATLTERERDVLQLLAEGRPASEVATHLFVSIHTARNHIAQILVKLHAHSQLEAVVIAARHGLVSIR